jgi:hypothetical protein
MKNGFVVSLFLFGALFCWGQAGKTPEKQQPVKPQPATGQQQGAQQQQGAAQQQQQEQAPELTIKVPVQRVNVPFVVIDSKNRYVTDLTRDDFTVYDNGKKMKIDFFLQVATLPLRAGLLLDTSNSIRLQWKPEQEAAIDFVHTLLPDRTRHKAFLMTFDSTRDIVQDFTSDPNDLADAIRKLKPGGGTSLFDAIYHSCWDKLVKETEAGGVRRVLVLITDGEDDASKYGIDQAIEIARRAQVSIYAISTVSYNQTSPGDAVLERLTEETGGYVVYPWKKPPSADFGTGYTSKHQIGDQNAIYEVGTGQYAGELAKNLAMALLQIHKELTQQYVIGYAPPNPTDGMFHEVKVVPREHDYRVRARRGYFGAPPL